jgi:hemolysin III
MMNGAAHAPRPRLRGVSHQIAFVLAVGATLALVREARPGASSLWAGVFGASLVALFGTSALYHRVIWRPGARRWMQRLDHSAVIVSIAGGYTPLLAVVPSQGGGHGALAVTWVGAAVGVARAVAWPHAPAWVSASLGIVLGSIGVGQVLDRAAAAGTTAVALFVASGLIYIVGAIVYVTKRPDPSPRVFGYHEVFHALIVAGTVLLFVHASLVLCPGG